MLKEANRKLKNARKKMAEEIASNITKEYDIIITEKLEVKEMTGKNKTNKKLRKEIINAAFSEIIRKINLLSACTSLFNKPLPLVYLFAKTHLVINHPGKNIKKL